jgi:2,4-dienoyl-CoA reductase-like NADH-dependent reductase (Old Yellow Enzyme family)
MPDQGVELKQHLTLLEPTEIASLRLKNRIVVAPMTCVSATDEGIPTERMASYYKEFADGEFGLIITQGIYPEKQFGQGYRRQPGLVTGEQQSYTRRTFPNGHQ